MRIVNVDTPFGKRQRGLHKIGKKTFLSPIMSGHPERDVAMLTMWLKKQVKPFMPRKDR